MNIKSVLFLIFLMFFANVAISDVIYLKDGRVIEGDILNRTSFYVTVAEDGTINDYYDDEIDRIDSGDAVPSSEPEEEKDSVEASSVPASDSVALIESVNDTKQALILKLMEVNGTRKDIKLRVDKLMGTLNRQQQEQLAGIFQVDEILNDLVPVYDKYYTEADLRAIINFYQSPAGQKVYAVTPDLIKEAVNTIVTYFREKLQSYEY